MSTCSNKLNGKNERTLYLEVMTTFVCNFLSNGSIGLPMDRDRTPGKGGREKEERVSVRETGPNDVLAMQMDQPKEARATPLPSFGRASTGTATGSDGFIRLGSLSKAALKRVRAAQLQTSTILTLSCRRGNGHPYVQANVRKNLGPKGISVKCWQNKDLPLISVVDITSRTTRYPRWQQTDAPCNRTPLLQHTHRATYISPRRKRRNLRLTSPPRAQHSPLRMYRTNNNERGVCSIRFGGAGLNFGCSISY